MHWHNRFLWPYFILLLIEIQFLSWGSSFLTIFCSFCVQSPMFVSKIIHKVVFSVHFCFLDFVVLFFCPYVDIAVIGCWDQSFFAPFFVYSSGPWIDSSMNSSMLSSPLCPSFLIYIINVIFLMSFGLLSLIAAAQRIEALSLYGSRRGLSEDSGFKSYPSRPEVYLVKNVVQ